MNGKKVNHAIPSTVYRESFAVRRMNRDFFDAVGFTVEQINNEIRAEQARRREQLDKIEALA